VKDVISNIMRLKKEGPLLNMDDPIVQLQPRRLYQSPQRNWAE
jgi:hypothetical protein